jgi:hypothetical protein
MKKSRNLPISSSPLSISVGNGKSLYAVAVEIGWQRRPDMLYFGAGSIEEVRAQLVGAAMTLPKGSKIVGVAPAIGCFENDSKLIV